jgi:uncharacterized protein YlxW (UPF0749 family)
MEIEILIDNGGNSKTTVKSQKGEDPACFVTQKLINELKGAGAEATNVKQDARTHGHTHTFH